MNLNQELKVSMIILSMVNMELHKDAKLQQLIQFALNMHLAYY